MEDPYCSVEDVQRETGNSDADLISKFEDCIEAASRWIDDYCLRDFLFHDYSVTPYTISDSEAVGYSLFIKWPIITLTEITSGDVLLDPSLYSFEVGGRSIILRDRSNWITKQVSKRDSISYGTQWDVARIGMQIPITLKGTFGYTRPPSAVKTACMRVAAAWSHEKRRERVDLQGGRISLLDERVPEEVTTMLRRFRRLVH